MLFTDQQRWDTISALGNQEIQTPALDALSRESVVFTRCYTPSPVCIPARFSLFSGQYPGRCGCSNNNGGYRYGGEGFYHEFTRRGYRSCCIGKMHHAKDPYGPMGFEKRLVQEELSDPRDDYTRFLLGSPYKNVFDYNGMRSEMYYIPQISQLPAEFHPTQWVGDRSVEFIEECGGDRPFFLMASFIHPHPPFAPPSPWNKLYRAQGRPAYMPPNVEEFRDFLSDRFTCEKLGVSPQDLTLLKNYYYACVSFVDYQIGRILAALRERGMADDTVVVFTSDHGEMLGDFGTLGKRSMLDASVRVPLLIRLPGGEGTLREDVSSLVDLPPTLLRLAGLDYDGTEYDGLDLFSGAEREVVFSQYSTGPNGVYMAASSRDKLIYHRPSRRYYYYDTIPEETNRYRADDPRIQALQRQLERYMAADACDSAQSGSLDEVSGVSRLPYGPQRVDHRMRRQEELARMPQGYTLDL